MGRDYATVSSQFWSGPTGRQIRNMGGSAQLVALYLITCPLSSATGIYYLPLPVLVHETNCPEDKARCILQALDTLGFATYDEAEERIWVREMARQQIAETLEPADKRWKWLIKEMESFRSSRFFEPFVERYHSSFNLPFEAPSKPHRRPSKGASRAQTEDSEAPSKPRARARARARTGARTGARTRAAARAPEAPAAAATPLAPGVPGWMDQELRALGISDTACTAALAEVGLDGLQAALYKLRSKKFTNPAGLLVKKCTELAQEGRSTLEKNLQRATRQVPGVLQESGWKGLPPALRDDLEVAAAWCLFREARQRESAASEDARPEIAWERGKVEAILLHLLTQRHPDGSTVIAQAESAVARLPEGLRAQAGRRAILQTLGLLEGGKP